jgi:hypothetical protein
MCRDCHQFYIITYEKNETGQAVETGYALDIRATSLGVVRPQNSDGKSSKNSQVYHGKKDEDLEVSCF